MFPRWLALIIAGILLTLAGWLLAPLIPIPGVDVFAQWALIIIGIAAVCYGVYLRLFAGPYRRDRV